MQVWNCSQFSQVDESSQFSVDCGPVSEKLPSPTRKQRRLFRHVTGSEEGEIGMFSAMSQDSFCNGNEANMGWSQEMSDRMGDLTFRNSDDSRAGVGGILRQSNDDFNNRPRLFSGGVSRTSSFNSNYGSDDYSMPPPPNVAKSSEISFLRRVQEKENVFTNVTNSNRVRTESCDSDKRQIRIPPALKNPFINEAFQPRKPKRTTAIFIAPYKERPRFASDFEQEAELGTGSSATVWAARKRLDGCLYAVKRLKLKIMGENGGLQHAKEAHALAALQGCRQILRYFSSWTEDNHFWIQTELCMTPTLGSFVKITNDDKSSSHNNNQNNNNNKSHKNNNNNHNNNLLNEEGDHDHDLFVPLAQIEEDMDTNDTVRTTDTDSTVDDNVIENNSNSTKNDNDATSSSSINNNNSIPELSEEVIWIIAKNLLTALNYMHQRNIAHLDVRPENILIRYPTSLSYIYDDSLHTIVKGISSGENELCLGDLGMCCRLNEPSNAFEGFDTYCAPELIESTSAHGVDLAACDMFSTGATLYELCKGYTLGGGGTNEWTQIRQGNLNNQVLQKYSQRLSILLRALLNASPSNRPNAAQCLQEFW